ncbi:MAG TPA: hypothetical protein VKG24_03435 [Pseudolabrys sp.]|nr:hypothetical protein [Pseudolabrys sp.]
MAGLKVIGLRPARMSKQEMRGSMPEWLLRQRPGIYAIDRKGALPRPVQPVKFGQPK